MNSYQPNTSIIKSFVITLLLFIPISLSAQTTYTVTASKLNVRATAATNGVIVGSLTRGERVPVNIIINGWAEIQYKGKARFVKSDYLQRVQNEQTDTKSVPQSQQYEHVTENNDYRQDNVYSFHKVESEDINTKKFKAWRPFIELQPDIVCMKGGKPMIDVLFGVTKGFGEYVSGGLGLGVQVNTGIKSVGMPVFARLQIEDKAPKLTPEFIIDAGYDVSFNGGGAVRLNPTIGIKANGLYAGAGYLASITTGKYGGVVHCVNIKLGYEFAGSSGKKAKSVRNFFKDRTYFNYEFGGGLNIGGESEDYKAGSNLQTLLSWNIIARPHWHTGFGAGFAWYVVNVESGDGFDLKGFPLFWRNRFVLLSSKQKLRPFFGLDLGAHIHAITNVSTEESEMNVGPFLNIEVGAIYKKRFNLSLGVTPCVVEAWEIGSYGHWDAKFSASSLNLALGVQF